MVRQTHLNSSHTFGGAKTHFTPGGDTNAQFTIRASRIRRFCFLSCLLTKKLPRTYFAVSFGRGRRRPISSKRAKSFIRFARFLLSTGSQNAAGRGCMFSNSASFLTLLLRLIMCGAEKKPKTRNQISHDAHRTTQSTIKGNDSFLWENTFPVVAGSDLNVTLFPPHCLKHLCGSAQPQVAHVTATASTRKEEHDWNFGVF